jgi:hypothetical protein
MAKEKISQSYSIYGKISVFKIEDTFVFLYFCLLCNKKEYNNDIFSCRASLGIPESKNFSGTTSGFGVGFHLSQGEFRKSLSFSVKSKKKLILNIL